MTNGSPLGHECQPISESSRFVFFKGFSASLRKNININKPGPWSMCEEYIVNITVPTLGGKTQDEVSQSHSKLVPSVILPSSWEDWPSPKQQLYKHLGWRHNAMTKQAQQVSCPPNAVCFFYLTQWAFLGLGLWWRPTSQSIKKEQLEAYSHGQEDVNWVRKFSLV